MADFWKPKFFTSHGRTVLQVTVPSHDHDGLLDPLPLLTQVARQRGFRLDHHHHLRASADHCEFVACLEPFDA